MPATAKQVLALKTLHICLAPGQNDSEGRIVKPAKIEVIPAGRIFEIEEKHFDEFVAEDAIRIATKADLFNADENNMVDLSRYIPTLNGLVAANEKAQ